MTQAVLAPATDGRVPTERLPAGQRFWPVGAALVPGLALAWWCHLALSWDGASFLFRIAHFGNPEVAHGRLASAVWQLPAVLAAKVGAPLGVTTDLFALGFVAVPLVALWLSWLVARDADPRLFTCAAFGILVCSATAQAFLVGEGLIALQLGWVVLLTAATGATTVWGRRLAVPIGLFVLFTHPTSSLVFVAAAGLLVARWWAGTDRRLRWRPVFAVALGLPAVAALRTVLTDAYERKSTGLDSVEYAWRFLGGWSSWPGAAMVLVAAAAIALVAAPAARDRVVQRLGERVPFVLLGIGGVALAIWASQPWAWERLLYYRSLNGVLAAPAMLAALVVVVTPRAAITQPLVRRCSMFVVAGAVIASTVLGLQALGWRQATNDLRAELAGAPAGCVTFHDLRTVRDAPFVRHWASAMLVLEVQGFSPRVIALEDAAGCRRYERTGTAELWPWGEVVADRGADGRFVLPDTAGE